MAQEQATLFPPSAGDDARRPDPYGRDELNLIELAFTTLGRARSRKTLKTEWKGKDHKGRTRKFYKTVTGSDEFGLPEYASEELLIALFHKASRDDFEARSVTAVPYELLQLMGWGTDGRAYERLKRALDQLAGVYITTNALWNPESGTFSKAGFHILDNYEFVEDADSGRTRLTVAWNERLFTIFQQSRFKRLDTSFFYDLPSPVAKRLYRWLDKHLRQTGHAEIDVLHLAHVKLEISHSKKYISQVMQVLEPALDELTERGYCSWAIADSQTDSGKKLVFDRIRRAAPALTTEHDGLSALSPTQRDLLEALAGRGLSVSAARTLVTDHEPDAVRRQVRHFDWLLASGEPPKSAGWFVAAIEKDFGLPPALLAEDKSAAARAGSAAAQSARQRKADSAREAEQARARQARDAVRERLAGLSDTERAELETRAVADLDSVNRARYRDKGLDAKGLRPIVEARMAELLDG
ncbi:MAG TPA: RepB family plasmid replication initiator protein [Bacteroidetes bacterium]|nr:hypothetical protein [Rhodothermaceae bacterium]MBC11349.1 hypothetical protein [Rhodothermaceae bacterium]HIG75255.1 RepB family plasmid replication initiator protein [Bacteroidota bacterium]HIL58897.1 RepB family plasmid replication initiator protein [Rhodothermales bacterium]